jgi:hypothetical protein
MQYIFLQNFRDDINIIREYIKHINLINKIEISNRESNNNSLKEFREHLHNFGTKKKIFEYKAIIISLYGILEKYICIWIKEHVDNLPSIIIDYGNLPEKIRENHFNLSVSLISLIQENRSAKYEHLIKENVLINLSSCINDPLNYSLNSDSFSPISGNLKHSKIVAAFKALDIELTAKLKINNKFSAFLKNKYGDNISNKGDELFSIVNDLVIRRNDIAHGENIDDILNITRFDEFLEFIEEYGKAIFSTIIEKENQYESMFLCRKINNVKGVYKKGSVLCFEIENYKIKKGDYIIVETKDMCFIKKEILEIEQDHSSFEELNIIEKTDIGINLGCGISNNQTFYIKK